MSKKWATEKQVAFAMELFERNGIGTGKANGEHIKYGMKRGQSVETGLECMTREEISSLIDELLA